MGEDFKLYFDNVSKAFPGVLALDHVSFGIKKGAVHIVVGENGAGKSTLMKIINGSFELTEGQMFLDGQAVCFKNNREAEAKGIGMIYQELQYIPEFSVERFLMMCREPERFKGIINWRELSRQARKLLDESNLDYDLKTPMKNLSVSDIQLLEITKVISASNVDVIIMDEPTSALSKSEVDRLFTSIRRLKERGITVIYISHKMDEIFKIADYITVMRDGRHIHTAPASDFTNNSLITMMVGRELSQIYPKEDADIGEIVLEVKHLSSSYSRLRDISFNVRKGEILGLAGLMGAGRTETVRALFGLDPISSGEVFIDGKKVHIRRVEDAIKLGLAMATEDRRRYGLMPNRSILENISIANLRQFSRGPFVNKRKEKAGVGEIFNRLRVKAPNMLVNTSTLSGGNQQKVVLCKWLLAKPRILILDEPTRGIDVGAKYEIYKLMTEMAKSGMAIIMISSELPEFIGMCDRAYTLNNGIVTGMLHRREMSQEMIMTLATGGAMQ